MNFSSSKGQHSAQTAVEYLLLLAMTAIIVFVGFRTILPNASQLSGTYFNKTANIIMGELPPEAPAACPDQYCSPSEDCMSCPADCGACPVICGQYGCQAGEDCANCPADCGPCASVCGDGTCDSTETCTTCPSDCGACPVVCGQYGCQAGEDCNNCPVDCGPCGGGGCGQPGELCSNVPPIVECCRGDCRKDGPLSHCCIEANDSCDPYGPDSCCGSSTCDTSTSLCCSPIGGWCYVIGQAPCCPDAVCSGLYCIAR